MSAINLLKARLRRYIDVSGSYGLAILVLDGAEWELDSFFPFNVTLDPFEPFQDDSSPLEILLRLSDLQKLGYDIDLNF